MSSDDAELCNRALFSLRIATGCIRDTNAKAVSIGIGSIGTDTSRIGIGQWYRYRFSRVSINFFYRYQISHSALSANIFYDI